ncbi:hypothetical protein [Bacillus toyonensis]|nr:hypothetical protein [Bacillus toyonensis]
MNDLCKQLEQSSHIEKIEKKETPVMLETTNIHLLPNPVPDPNPS